MYYLFVVFNNEKLFNISIVCCFCFQILFRNLRTKQLLMHMLPSHKSKAAKRRWLHPPTLAPSQASPPRKAKTRTHLKINDHVS